MVLFATTMAATQLVLLVMTLAVVLSNLSMYSELVKTMKLVVVVMKSTVMMMSNVAKLVVILMSTAMTLVTLLLYHMTMMTLVMR